MTNRPGDRHVLHPGDKVMATDGYSIPGIVLSRFIMTDGEIRYAVEHRVEGGKIPLIYADKNLELVERGFEGKREDASDAEIMTDEGRPSIPPEYSAPLDPRPSRVLIQDRIDNLAAAKTAAPLACWCCDGTGKAFNAIDMCMDPCLICGGKTAAKSDSQPGMTAAPLDLNALEAKIAAATPAPWQFSPWHIEEGPSAVRAPEGWVVASTSSDANAELIAALRNAAPALIAAARERNALRERIDDVNGVIGHTGLEPYSPVVSAKLLIEELKAPRAEIAKLREALRLAEPIVDLWAAYASRNLEGSEQYAADNALAKARAALGKPSVTEPQAGPHPPTP